MQVGRGDVGSLSVGFVSIADYGILPPALKSFRAQFPLVEVHLHELTTDAQIRELRAATLDLGIGLAPVDEPDLEFTSVLREELVLAAPSGHPALKRDGAIDMRVLARDSFIVPPRDVAPGLYDLTISYCRSFRVCAADWAKRAADADGDWVGVVWDGGGVGAVVGAQFEAHGGAVSEAAGKACAR